MNMTEEKKAVETDPMYMSMLLTLESSAMQALGKIMNPMTQKIEKNLDQAQMTIDMIAMLEKKTAGNLSPDEDSLTKRALYQLRMNYLDEVKTDKEAPKETEPQKEEEPIAAEPDTKNEENTDKTTE
jgi:Domain of unknown function (DUF1844)